MALDLLRKSGLGRDAVAEGSNEIHPEVKSASSMTISFLQNSKDFEPPDDMFHRQSDLSESSVIGACGVGERVMLAGLFRRPGVRVLVLNPLIPSVGEEFRVRMDGRLRLPQESKIMRRPAARGDAEDLARDRMHQELQFQRVALLLPAVPVPLLSWAERCVRSPTWPPALRLSGHSRSLLSGSFSASHELRSF